MPSQIRAAFVYIAKDDQVLLLQEGGKLAHGLWALPGGHVDPGESFEQAAIREALEESGYNVVLGDVLYQTELPAVDYKGAPEDTGQIALTVFTAKIVGGVLTKDDEALDLKWFPLSEATRLQFRWDFLKELVSA